MTRVAVRIRRHDGGWIVVGRVTRVRCATFDEAWAASIPYVRGVDLTGDDCPRSPR